MKYRLLTIVGSVLLLTGCGQTNFAVNENTKSKDELQKVAQTTSTVTVSDIQTEEPKFEDSVKTAGKDGNGNIILTSEMRYAFPGCKSIESGFLPPNKTVSYENAEQGISFSIPYNEAWSFCGYVLDEYDETSGKVYDDSTRWEMTEFGGLQLAPESGSSLSRLYHLAFMPTSTPEKLMAEHAYPLLELKKMKINNLTVVREYDPPPEGMGCSSLSYYIFGKKAMYEFGGYCVETSIGNQEYTTEEFSKELEQIIKTVKLI